MGRVHAEAYRNISGVTWLGIADSNPVRARELAAACGGKAFSSLDEAVAAHPDLDVIDICLPTFLHKEMTIKAARHAKAVICEKPLAGNPEDAQEMIDSCRKLGAKLFVAHVVRFFPAYRSAKQWVDRSGAEKIGTARCSRIGPFPAGWQNWYNNDSQSGGPVMDLMIHDLDFLRWCFGEAERVYAKMTPPEAGMAYALAAIRFRSGVIAHVESSWAHDVFTTSYEFAGKSGIIEHNSAREVPLVIRARASGTETRGVAVPESPLVQNPYEAELSHFLDCLASGAEPLVTAEDALKAVELGCAVRQSAFTGQPVDLLR